jgi:hypothetical protein
VQPSGWSRHTSVSRHRSARPTGLFRVEASKAQAGKCFPLCPGKRRIAPPCSTSRTAILLCVYPRPTTQAFARLPFQRPRSLLFGNLDRAPERCFGLARVPEGGMCEQLALAVRTHGRGPMRCPDRSARRQVSLQFWRPVTAIRNGDIDDNAATERDAAWQPIDATPMHPEYPCAHCISSGSLAGVVEAVFGTAKMPEVAIERRASRPNGSEHSGNLANAFPRRISRNDR